MNDAAARKRRQLRLEEMKAAERAPKPRPGLRKFAPDAASAPDELTPEKFPDPWLYHTPDLLRDLDTIRELILKIPLTHASFTPTNAAVCAVWELRQRLQYLCGLHADMQRSWRTKDVARRDGQVKAVPQQHAPRKVPAVATTDLQAPARMANKPG